MSEYHNNTCGIATFKAKPQDEAVSDLSVSGMIEEIVRTGLGVFTVNLTAPLPNALYQPVFTAPPGFATGIIYQNESSFVIGLKDSNGDWIDCAELMTVSFNRLTEAIE